MRAPRRLAVVILLICTLVLSALFLTAVFSQIYREIRGLLVTFPAKIITFKREVDRIQSLIKDGLQLPEEFWEGMLIKPENLMEKVGGLLQRVLNLLKGLPVFLLNLFLSGLAAYWFSQDQNKMSHFILSFLPNEWRRPVIKVYQELLLSISGFLKVQLMLGVITGLCASFLMAVFGFPRFGLIGLTVGMLDLLPMIGPSILLLPWAGWMFFTGAIRTGVLLLLILLILYGLRQLAEVYFLDRSLGLHPLVTIISLYLGVRLFGFYGFVLGPLFFLLIRSFYYRVLPLLETDQTL